MSIFSLFTAYPHGYVDLLKLSPPSKYSVKFDTRVKDHRPVYNGKILPTKKGKLVILSRIRYTNMRVCVYVYLSCQA